MAITPPPIVATDFSMWRGTTKARLLTFTNKSTGAPLNLAGCTIRAVFKLALTDSDATAALTYTNAVDGGITVADDPTLGLATLLIPPADTDGLKQGKDFVSAGANGITYLDLLYAVRLIIAAEEQDIDVYGTLTVWESAARQITP